MWFQNKHHRIFPNRTGSSPRYSSEERNTYSLGWTYRLPNASEAQRALAEQLLRFNPHARLSVGAAIASSFFDTTPELPKPSLKLFLAQREAEKAGGAHSASFKMYISVVGFQSRIWTMESVLKSHAVARVV